MCECCVWWSRQSNALYCAAEIAKIPGLSVNRPEGAMYIMVRLEKGAFPAFANDYDFAQALLLEEGVFVLAGKVRLLWVTAWLCLLGHQCCVSLCL